MKTSRRDSVVCTGSCCAGYSREVSQTEGEVSGPEPVEEENSPSPGPTPQDLPSDTVVSLTQLIAEDMDLLREQIVQPEGALRIVLAMLAEATEPMSVRIM